MRYVSGHEEHVALEYVNQTVLIALQATCQRDRCGSIIVQNNEIIGTGFNSPPGNHEHQRRCTCEKDNYHKKVKDTTCCIHAEQRAIMDALQHNPDKISGARLYFIRLDEEGKPVKAGQPYCTICSKMALDVGIGEFVLWHNEGVCVYTTDEYNTRSFAYTE